MASIYLNSNSELRYKFLFIQFLLLFFMFMTAKLVQAEDLPVSRFSEGMNGWEQKSFKGTTDYRLVNENGTHVVKATSNGTASGLVKKMAFDPYKYRFLRWSWKIDHTVSSGDERTKAGDDYAARVYVIFSGKFFWQTRAINYIWANRLGQGKTMPNVFTKNAMMVAVESGETKKGKWLSEERDILSDYRQLFGEDPGQATAIAIMTDTDNTGLSATGWYGDISLSTMPQKRPAQ